MIKTSKATAGNIALALAAIKKIRYGDKKVAILFRRRVFENKLKHIQQNNQNRIM